MAAKTQQLQIRVSPQQKIALKRHAKAAGRDVSSYVLSRLLPPERDRFTAILRSFETGWVEGGGGTAGTGSPN